MRKKRNRLSKPHFNLRDKHSIKETPIFLFYKYSKDKERLKYSIKETVLPKYWDQNIHRVKVSLNYPKHLKLNSKLNDIENEAQSLVQTFGTSMSHDKFKTELDYYLNIQERPSPKGPPSFFKFLDSFIEEQKAKSNYRTVWII